jgi:serine/threonine-protein kinase RsbT
VERVLGTHRLEITDEHDVIVVRGRVRDLAERHGFDVFATAAITTATSELTRNVWSHGGGGHALIEELERDGGSRGLRIRFEDEGPGIVDINRAMMGGFSTRRSLGLGLSGSQRLVDEFVIDSAPGQGTTVVIAKWARYARA